MKESSRLPSLVARSWTRPNRFEELILQYKQLVSGAVLQKLSVLSLNWKTLVYVTEMLRNDAILDHHCNFSIAYI